MTFFEIDIEFYDIHSFILSEISDDNFDYQPRAYVQREIFEILSFSLRENEVKIFITYFSKLN